MPDPPPQSYAKHLQPLGYGYPLWTPEPPHELLVRRRDGLRIGDVGVIDLENGSFDVFFNICLPRDHPLHRVTGVPDNFVPVELDEWDIASFPHAEYPGRVISSSSVTATTVVEPSGEATPCPFTYEFNLASSEGALLILPKGAESYKLRKRQTFKDIATRNATDWYNFAEQHLGRMITRDSLYLITGLYKTDSWSVAAFHQATGSAGSSAQFKASYAGGGNNVTYAWETMRALDWRVGPQIDVGIPNQSVFISGFKIAIREGILGKKRVEVEIDAPPPELRRHTRFNSGRGNSSNSSKGGSLWRRVLFRGGSGGRGSAEQASEVTHSTEDPGTTFLSASRSDNADTVRHVTVKHVPPPPQSLHPSDVVNRYLLTNEPSANVAITHDSEWGILFEKGLLKLEDLGRNGRLEKIVSENYRLISQNGAVCLQAICDTSIRLLDIDDAVREAWKEDRLEDAEELLSRQSNHHMGVDHSAFANRALIRARLHHWDAALRDAETSMSIQPSVVAHVAKGLAFFGKDKYELGVEAFNVALRQCDTRDRDVVLLIKYIVLYGVGYHAEGMAGISDLMEYCSAEVKSACTATQAEMCVRLAKLTSERENYDRALHLLSRAQSLGPFQEVPDLKILSLICGWRFDNLQFSIHRQKCEVLFVAGRISEALDCFRRTMRDFGEEVRTRKDNAEWINSFTPQCLRLLESLGDNAMTSQNYTEAVSSYSMALSMSPNARDGILIKRSKAYMAARAWDGALRDADEAIRLNPRSPLGYERRHEALQCMGRYAEAVQTLNDMRSILERPANPQSQKDLHSGYTDPLQSTAATRISGPRTLDILSHPTLSPDRSSVVEPTVMGSQSLATRHLEQQHSDQLGQLVTQITALLEQLGSNAVVAQHDQLRRNPSTAVLHGHGATIPREDVQSQTMSSLSLPGNSVAVFASSPAPDVVVPSVQTPLQKRHTVLTTPSEHVRDTDVQRSPSTRASPEHLPPAPPVKMLREDTGLPTPRVSRSRGHQEESMVNLMDRSAPDEGRPQLHGLVPDDERRSQFQSRSRSHSTQWSLRTPPKYPQEPEIRWRPQSQWSGGAGGYEFNRDSSPAHRHEGRERMSGSNGEEEPASKPDTASPQRRRPSVPGLLSPVIITHPEAVGSSTHTPDSRREIESLTARWVDQHATQETPHVSAKTEPMAAEQQPRQRGPSVGGSEVPFNIQGYLDEFTKALATEVRMLLGEVGKLREERHAIQHELGYLMMMKSMYGPGGEFNADWKPPMTFGVPPPPPLPFFPPPPPPKDLPPARPSWRIVPQRSSRRARKMSDFAPPEPVKGPRPQDHSWVTWQPDPLLAPTPPSVEPTLLVADRGSPGLFGPRSPRDSYHS